MAHIREYETKNGPHWQVMYRVTDRGKARQVSSVFTNGKGAAEFAELVDRIGGDAAREVLDARRGSSQAGKIPTVAEALTDHIENLSGITLGTRRDYEKIATRFARSRLGPLPVDAVTKDAVRKWVNAQTVAAKTIRNRHALLYAAMERQVELKNIDANPCSGIRIGRSEQKEMVTLTWPEFCAVRAELDEHWHPFVTFLAGTGLRFGEASAVQVRDFDMSADPPEVRVARSWKHTDGSERELGAPKSSKGRRTVALSPEVDGLVRPLLHQRGREAFVFVNKAGRPIRQNSFHEVWSAALDDADIGKRPRLHDLRHTYASWMLRRGVSLSLLQRLMGHEDIRTTVNTYGHMAEDAMSIAAQAAALAMSPALPELVGDPEQMPDAPSQIIDGPSVELEA